MSQKVVLVTGVTGQDGAYICHVDNMMTSDIENCRISWLELF